MIFYSDDENGDVILSFDFDFSVLLCCYCSHFCSDMNGNI